MNIGEKSIKRNTTLDRHASLTLYSGPACLDSHRIRLMLSEKQIEYKTVFVAPGEKNKDLENVNPHNSVPALTDRDIVLYEMRAMMEYLEERFPYPPLMPNDPIGRANLRLNLHHIETTWCDPMREVEKSGMRGARNATALLRSSLKSAALSFKDHPFFMSEEVTSLDCCIATVLWRVHCMNIFDIKTLKPIALYANRVFARPEFRRSLTHEEADMQKTK